MHTFSSEPQLHSKSGTVVFPRPGLRENPPSPHLSAQSLPPTGWACWSDLTMKGLQYSVWRGCFPAPTLKCLWTHSRFPDFHRFHGDSRRAWGPSAQWKWVCPPSCSPDALLSLSLTILDGSLLPSIKLDWISIKKSNSFLSLSEALSEVSSKCNLLYKWEFPCDTCGSR